MKIHLLCLARVALARNGTRLGPPPPQSPLMLAVEDVGVTKAWLQLGLSAQATPRTVDLKRSGQVIDSLTPTASDTVIAVDSLFLNQNYLFARFRAIDAIHSDNASVRLTTMDMTSHNLTWEIDTLGDVNPSALYEAVIVTDTTAYAVGEVYMLDGLGNYDCLTSEGSNIVMSRANLIRVPLDGIRTFAPPLAYRASATGQPM